MQSKSKPLVWIVIGAVLLAGILIINKPTPMPVESEKSVPGNGPSLAFSPSKLKLKPGEQATVSLNLQQDGLPTAAVTISLSYDPAKVKIISLNGSSLFTNVLSSAKFSSGLATLSLAVPPDSKGQVESGTVAVLELESLSSGSSKINFDADTMAVALEQEGNILKNLGTLTIN